MKESKDEGKQDVVKEKVLGNEKVEKKVEETEKKKEKPPENEKEKRNEKVQVTDKKKPKEKTGKNPDKEKEKNDDGKDPGTPGGKDDDLGRKRSERKREARGEYQQNIYINEVIKFDNKGSGDSGKEKEEDTFKDPTRPLPESFSQLPLFMLREDIRTNVALLREKRLALLVSRSDDVLRSMAYTMAQFHEFNGCDKRMLNFDRGNAERGDLQLDMFVEKRIGKGEDMVVLAEIESHWSFFDSIFGASLSFHDINEGLRKKNIHLICMVNTSLLEKVSADKQHEFLFHRWEIDFLPYLMEHKFRKNAEHETLTADVVKQREYGLWDRSRDDEEFFGLISGYIRRSRECFVEEVRKRNDFIAGGKTQEEFWASMDRVNPDDLFAKPEPHKTVLYTAAFFDQLTPIDFEQVVKLLIKDQTKTVEKEIQVQNEDKELQTIKQEEIVQLTDEWERDADKILNECGLRAVRADDLSQYIEFSHPYMRNRIMKHITEEHPMYLRRKFAILQKLGILFSPSASQKVIENVIRLSTEMALINPAHFGADWLMDFIKQMRMHFDVPDIPGEDDFEELLKALLTMENENQKRQIYSRLAGLIREMLNHPQLKGMITNFLNKLIEGRHHEDALVIVWEVGKRLRFAPKFNLLNWLKRLMEQGVEEVKGKAYLYVFELANQRKHEIYEVLDTLKTWLPKEDAEFKSYSRPQKFALAFGAEYCVKSAFEFDFKFYGIWPSEYPLFVPLKKDRSLTCERLKDLVAWLLHPGMQDVLYERLPDDDKLDLREHFKAITVVAELFEIWALILLGSDTGTPPPEAVQGLDMLVRCLYEIAGKYQRKQLMRTWGLKREFYRTSIHGLPIKEKEEREKLRSQYKLASLLISRFKELKNQDITAKEVES